MDSFPRIDAPLFEIGRDPGGHWLARSADGREGGVFVSRDEAEKFARSRGGLIASAREPLSLWRKSSRSSSL